MKKISIRWAIVGIHGLYTGQHLRMRDAIKEHVNDLFIIPSGRFLNEKEAWDYCKRKGDKATKVEIIWSAP